MATITQLSTVFDHGFDDIIDVRSPAEFEEDHVPGALSLPVLDNDERAEVGTLYKRSAFDARKLGAAMVFRNAAMHIEQSLAHHTGGWRPLIYCWRGGQRSGSFAWMLKEIGWRSDTIEGGYRTYRRLVVKTLYDEPLPYSFIKLNGHTGTAKTKLLHLLSERGVQVIDLEGLANHRGSLLGGMASGQPSQKWFETQLAQKLHALDATKPVFIEAESSKIGGIIMPRSLWVSMKASPVIEVRAPVWARAKYLASEYEDVLADARSLKEKLLPLRRVRGAEILENWFKLIDEGKHVELCQVLATEHYDPAYTRSSKLVGQEPETVFETAGLTSADLDRLADQIAAYVQTKMTSPEPTTISPIAAAS
ncbi:MAG: tRNA 2-selenouridine(34) synthase MnmH [Pseudomonadota bacterium]